MTLKELLAFAMWMADYGIDDVEVGWQINVHYKEWQKHADCCDWCESGKYRHIADELLLKFKEKLCSTSEEKSVMTGSSQEGANH